MNTATMKAVGVLPKKREVALLQHPAPRIAAPTEVRIKTIEVGICGTDREICTFAYGSPPADSDYLVLGHEALGQVVEIGPRVTAFKPGDLVVPTVRRPCPHDHCVSCRDARQDFCFTGDFTERGIKMVHGYMTEFFVEDQAHLNAVPPGLRDIAVLVEPLTVAEKALTQLWQVQGRLNWSDGKGPSPGAGKTAVVLGAGPVGILGAMALLARGFRVFVYSRSADPNPKSDLVNSVGARYISSEKVPLADFAKLTGPIDVVYEAVGVAQIAFDVLRILGLNGVFIFTGIPAEKPAIPIEADTLMRQIVLKNQAIIGTVNADRAAFENAISDLGEFQRRWPAAIRKVISGRHPMENHRELLLGKQTGIKQVITISG